VVCRRYFFMREDLHSQSGSGARKNFLRVSRYSLLRSNRRGNGDHGAHVGDRPDPVRYGNVADENIAGFGWQGPVLRQKFTFAFQDENGKLTLKVMRVDGQLLSCPEVEVQDFEIG
jgi:hypothetical protein